MRCWRRARARPMPWRAPWRNSRRRPRRPAGTPAAAPDQVRSGAGLGIIAPSATGGPMTKIGYVSRREGLDALRGFALFGLFIVHMPELFELYWLNPVSDPLQKAVHDTVWLLLAGKAFALMALCFGVSFFIIMDRSAQRGVDFTGRFVWRLALLALMGLLHGLWYRGDILEVLALMGLLLVPFYRVRSNRVLLWLAAAFMLQ